MESHARIYYMDNARAFASIMGIFYHSMYVMARHWHINVTNPEMGKTLYEVISFINQFRMPMFLIFSGFFAAYMLQKYKGQTFIKKRVERILFPFTNSVILLIPLQLFFELQFKHNDLWTQFFWELANPFNKKFSLMHLWFLYHIFMYSLLFVGVYWISTKLSFKWLINKLPYNSFFYSVVWLVVTYLFYRTGRFIDHQLNLNNTWFSFQEVGDHLPFFIFGIHFFYNRLLYERSIISGSNLTIVLYLVVIVMCYCLENFINDYSSMFGIINKWVHVLFVLNVFRKTLNFTSNMLSYLADASYPVYIFHQPVIIIISYFTIHFLEKGSIYFNYLNLVIISIIVTYTVYEFLVRRFPVGQLIFTGYKSNPKSDKVAL